MILWVLGQVKKKYHIFVIFLISFIGDGNKMADLVLDSWWRFRRFWVCNFLNFFYWIVDGNKVTRDLVLDSFENGFVSFTIF